MNANPGESLYLFIERVVKEAHIDRVTIEATHNNITVTVYPFSHEYDIEDKFAMQRKINLMGK